MKYNTNSDDLKKPLVLVVDDQEIILKSVASYLKRLEYRAMLVRDGYEALELAGKHRPDIILSDLNMPRMDGFTIIRRLRLEDCFSFTPIIMFTDDTQKQIRSKAFRLGADDFISKEHMFEEMEHRLERALTFSRLRERLAAVEMKNLETEKTAFKGSLDLFGVSCLISMGRMEAITGTLKVETPSREIGLIYFQAGEIMSAKVVGSHVVKNQEAVTMMMSWIEGSFELGQTDNSSVPREMEISTESILLEAATALDEMRITSRV